jgi:endonuclease/exonuclease/phosphatase family metal-dependent hydrolase
MAFKKILFKLERALLYINFIFAALLLISYLSAVISPAQFWPLAFLGLAYPILLGLNLFFLIYWTLRLKKYFFISAISILFGFNILLNSIGFSNSAIAPQELSSDHLKLMTYNVHDFNVGKGQVNVPANKQIVELINLNQPDIIGFEEFYTQHSRFGILDSLKKTLHTNQFYFEPFKSDNIEATGLALFSKYPIVSRGIIRFSNEKDENQGIYADIKYKAQIIRVYDFHLQSLHLNDGDYLNLNGFSHSEDFSFRRLAVIFLKFKFAFIKRAQQVNLIREHAAKCPYPYIFMGDFNDIPSSYAFNQLAKGMKNTFEEKGAGIGRTFYGGFVSFQIDYILVSKQFHVLDYQIIHKEISDHYPVCTDVVLH